MLITYAVGLGQRNPKILNQNPPSKKKKPT
nr:MAG TPA: hypothetical protein [Caudoviricetes sp.]